MNLKKIQANQGRKEYNRFRSQQNSGATAMAFPHFVLQNKAVSMAAIMEIAHKVPR